MADAFYFCNNLKRESDYSKSENNTKFYGKCEWDYSGSEDSENETVNNYHSDNSVWDTIETSYNNKEFNFDSDIDDNNFDNFDIYN